jgi:GTPase
MSQKIGGNTRGLPPSQIKRVQRLFVRKLERDEIVSLDLAREIYSAAADLRRRVGVLATREGQIVEVFLGTKEILYMPDLGRYRLGAGRLRRLRLIFSDLSSDESYAHIPADVYTDLEKLRFDMVVGVKTVRNRSLISFAYNLPAPAEDGAPVRTERVGDLGRLEFNFADFIGELEAEHVGMIARKRPVSSDLCVLVGVYAPGSAEPEASMRELQELARTAGVEVADSILQLREPDARTLLGKGKLEEVLLRCLRVGAGTVVFDAELRPSQWRAITNSTDLKVLDRSMLILDIFSQRAKSSDGRLQVELAQLKYSLPRLVEKDAGLSRFTGGIGGRRGPGETKLEIGRRRIRERIRALEKRIDQLSRRRTLRRRSRQAHQLPLVAILGYTNVGKSTLFNALTGSDVFVEDKLFATLDPAQRRLFLPQGGADEDRPQDRRGRFAVLADTVCFIRDLPAELVSAFRATLEELRDACVLVHVLDASDPQIHKRKEAVDQVLAGMQLADLPQVIVLNKCDLVDHGRCLLLEREFGGVAVSALRQSGLAELLARIQVRLRRDEAGLTAAGRNV